MLIIRQAARGGAKYNQQTNKRHIQEGRSIGVNSQSQQQVLKHDGNT